MQKVSLPDYVVKYFWGDNLSELSLEKHEDYIVQTLLDRGDQKAMSWLLSLQDKKSLREKLSRLTLTPRSKKFWNLYLQ